MSNLSSIIKSIQDTMRKDAGVDGDAQRISQMGWMLFLKIFDAKENDWEISNDDYKSPIPKDLRWRNWADDAEGMTGDELLSFINNSLFPRLKVALTMEINIDLFKHFLPKYSDKGSNIFDNNCVINTRVSTKDQEDNTSLAYQKERCEEYARKKGYNIVAYFGGIYESAKNDERKEFKRMMDFVKNPKNKVSRIIVLSFDRFSRSGCKLPLIGLYKSRLFS